MIEELEPGHRLNDLDHHNSLVQAINALLRKGGRQGKAAWAVFQLTEDVKYPDPEDVTFPAGWSKVPDVPYAENCKRIFLNHYDNDYEEHLASPVTDHDVVYFPTVPAWDGDAPPVFRDDQRVVAFYNEQSGRWEVILHCALGTLMARFEVKTVNTLTGTAGGTGTAYLYKYDGGYGEDTAIEFEICDVFGAYRARAKGTYGSPHADGSQGYVIYAPDADAWEVQWMQPHALAVWGTAKGAVSGSGFDIDNVVIMNPVGAIMTAWKAASGSTFELAITNRFTHDGDDDANVFAVWDETANEWMGIQMTCPA